MAKVILFDLDGTLVKAGGAGRRALNEAVRRLHGVSEVCSEFSLAGRTDKDNFRLAFHKAVGRRPDAREAARLEQAYLARLPRHVDKAVADGRYELIPGIKRFLKALRERKALIGLGTGNIKEGAHIKLRPSGLLDHFHFGGFGSDGYRRVKVLRTAVQRASQILGRRVSARDVYVIGDTHKDVAAGKQAGYHTGVVTCGFGEMEEIRKSSPEFMAEDFADLEAWLLWLNLELRRAKRDEVTPSKGVKA